MSMTRAQIEARWEAFLDLPSGLTYVDMARRLDCGKSTIWEYMKHVRAGTEPCLRKAAGAPRSKKCRADDAVVERVISGDYVGPLNIAERWSAFVILQKMGLTADAIALRLGCTDKTVQRYRKRLRDLGN